MTKFEKMRQEVSTKQIKVDNEYYSLSLEKDLNTKKMTLYAINCRYDWIKKTLEENISYKNLEFFIKGLWIGQIYS